MPYKLTADEIKLVEAEYLKGPSPWGAGDFSSMYRVLSEILSTPRADGKIPTDDVDVQNSVLWLDVAVGANSNEGMHSAVIRTFTNVQAELRLGHPISEKQMQAGMSGSGLAFCL